MLMLDLEALVTELRPTPERDAEESGSVATGGDATDGGLAHAPAAGVVGVVGAVGVLGTSESMRSAGSALAPRSSASPGSTVEMRRLGKSFGDREVLQGIDLRITPGEFVAIVGRSGCGKSTLLRLLAGLDEATAGELLVDQTPLSARREDTRIMFQDARLLPWKTVAQNICLGLRSPDAAARAGAALASVGLTDRANDWPSVLSGGQRQRVALARALVHTPRLLLLDEPLGALDALTRIEMQQLIERLWRQRGFTALLVTHDVSEAVALADRVVLIENGRIALDEPVVLPRPRSRGNPHLAAIEALILDRILRHDSTVAEGGPEDGGPEDGGPEDGGPEVRDQIG